MDSTLLQLALPYKDDGLINWSIKFMKISRTNNSDNTATIILMIAFTYM